MKKNITFIVLAFLLFGDTLDKKVLPTNEENIPISEEMFRAVDHQFGFLVGYRTWFNPNITISMEQEYGDTNPSDVLLHIDAPEAMSMMISRYLDFEGVEWEDVQKTLKWSLPGYGDEVILWMIFKRYNDETKKYEVTQPISYVYLKSNVYKKIILFNNAYWDLTDQRIVAYSHVTRLMSDEKSRYKYYMTHLNIKNNLITTIYENFSNIMINQKFFLNFIYSSHTSDFLDDLYRLVNVLRISYDSEQSGNVYFKYELNQSADSKKFNIYKDVRSKFHFDPISIKKNYGSTEYTNLVMDIRGVSGYVPSLFPIFEDTLGNPILNGFSYNSFDKPFVRYLRASQGVSINGILPEKADTKTLYIRAFKLKGNDKSVIIIEPESIPLLQINEVSYNNFTNGHLYIIMD